MSDPKPSKADQLRTMREENYDRRFDGKKVQVPRPVKKVKKKRK